MVASVHKGGCGFCAYIRFPNCYPPAGDPGPWQDVRDHCKGTLWTPHDQIITHTAPAPLAAPDLPPPIPTTTPTDRHTWSKIETHHYVCQRCGMVKRNWIDPDFHDWFTTYQAPGAAQVRSAKTPRCTT